MEFLTSKLLPIYDGRKGGVGTIAIAAFLAFYNEENGHLMYLQSLFFV